MRPFPTSGKPPETGGAAQAPTATELNLDPCIAEVAAERSESAIQEKALEFAQRFGPEVIPELRRRFHVMIAPPPTFAAREPSASAWIGYWQAALYAILYNYRAHALPALREMAGDQDGQAMVLLCRLAAEGVERDAIVADLVNRMAALSPSLLASVADELLARSRMQPALAAVLEELRQAPEFESALAEAKRFSDEESDWRPPAPPVDRSRDVAARRAALATIAVALGVGVAGAVADATGWGWAAFVGTLAMALSGVILAVLEKAVLNRM